MQRKALVMLEMAKPRVLLLMCLLSLAGAALSPYFLSPDFPTTRLGGTALFQWLGSAFPRVFSPPMWSLAHALGGALVVGLLWAGCALINDMADAAIDQVSNPERPVPARRATHREVLKWALVCQSVALLLILAEGSRVALVLAMAGAGLGNAYSLPPLRLRRSGLAANLIIGGGVAMAMVGGMLAQGAPPEVGLLSAATIGLMAAAASMVKDFKDVAGDRAQGIRTLPVVVGYRRAVLINMAAVAAAYAVAGVLLMHRIGVRPPVFGLLTGLGAANLAALWPLLSHPGPQVARKAYRWALLIFMGEKVRKLQQPQVLFGL